MHLPCVNSRFSSKPRRKWVRAKGVILRSFVKVLKKCGAIPLRLSSTTTRTCGCNLCTTLGFSIEFVSGKHECPWHFFSGSVRSQRQWRREVTRCNLFEPHKGQLQRMRLVQGRYSEHARVRARPQLDWCGYIHKFMGCLQQILMRSRCIASWCTVRFLFTWCWLQDGSPESVMPIPSDPPEVKGRDWAIFD